MTADEVSFHVRRAGLVQDLGFGNSLFWDNTQNSWVLTDGERRLCISEGEAKEMIEELIASF